ncbi:MAG TPA: hypothetical protein VGR34_06490 [Candidatus Dormibacteraeota bacterium]|nr:hypothetical protein [Candidatus Dormibacteraeota bacterium]
MTHWNRAYLIGWPVLVFTVVVYEIWAALHGHVDPTLTDVVSRYVPWWATMPVLTLFLPWLWLHFASQYTYPKWLLKIIGG